MLKDRRLVTEKLNEDGAYNDFALNMENSKETQPTTARFSYASYTADHRYSNVNSDFYPSTQLQSPTRTPTRTSEAPDQSQWNRSRVPSAKKQAEKNYEITFENVNDCPFQMADDCEEKSVANTTTILDESLMNSRNSRSPTGRFSVPVQKP